MATEPPPERPDISPRWPGYFVVIEGIDGSGKSTLARAVRDRLEAEGVPAVLSGEPTGGPIGRRIRELARSGREAVSPEEEVELFAADRRHHVETTILPSLREGKAVILDRYYYSSMAYQSRRGVDMDFIRRKNEAFAPSPDLLVVLKLPVETALERIAASRGEGPDHFEGVEHLKAIDRIFDELEHPNLLRLDATLATPEMVERIWARLRLWIERRGEA